jgi:hypothetical protein
VKAGWIGTQNLPNLGATSEEDECGQLQDAETSQAIATYTV